MGSNALDAVGVLATTAVVDVVVFLAPRSGQPTRQRRHDR